MIDDGNNFSEFFDTLDTLHKQRENDYRLKVSRSPAHGRISASSGATCGTTTDVPVICSAAAALPFVSMGSFFFENPKKIPLSESSGAIVVTAGENIIHDLGLMKIAGGCDEQPGEPRMRY